jgi:hypothetical protein
MEPNPILEELTLLSLGLFLGIVMGIVWLFVWALLRAAQYPSPTTLTVSLSLLTFVSIAGAIISQSTELITLAATGLGALAGAVSSQYDKKDPPTDKDGSPPKGP